MTNEQRMKEDRRMAKESEQRESEEWFSQNVTRQIRNVGYVRAMRLG